MPTLAPKLPWSHPYAPGYPGRGSQALPTDPDAVDYLNRVAAADGGVSVEVGIAQAIDGFVKGCKADGTWNAIKASCILCGARTLAGALVPLKGTAPTPYNFVAGDYSRSGATPGIKGDGSTKYLDTNRANNADGQDDFHVSAYITSIADVYVAAAGPTAAVMTLATTGARNRSGTSVNFQSTATAATLAGSSRSDASQVTVISNSQVLTSNNASSAPGGDNINMFGYIYSGQYSANRLAFYSLGSAIDLAALDTRVTNLVTAIRFHTLTGLLPNDYDPATIAYITAAYAAGGTL